MSAKNEVIEILDDRIEELNRGMEHFIRFGNKGNVESLQKQTERSIQLVELVSLKARIEFGKRWQNEREFSVDCFVSPLASLEQVLRVFEEFYSDERFEDMDDAFELIESYKKAVSILKGVTE